MRYIAFSLATDEPRGFGRTAQGALDVMAARLPMLPPWIEIVEINDDTLANALYVRGETLPLVRSLRQANTVYRGGGRTSDGLPAVAMPALRFEEEVSHDHA